MFVVLFGRLKIPLVRESKASVLQMLACRIRAGDAPLHLNAGCEPIRIRSTPLVRTFEEEQSPAGLYDAGELVDDRLMVAKRDVDQ